MKVDLSKLNMVCSGVAVEGIAESANLTLPATRPEGLCVCCKHLAYDDEWLMHKGSVFKQETGEAGERILTYYILCKECVILTQHFPSEKPDPKYGTVRQRANIIGNVMMGMIGRCKGSGTLSLFTEQFLLDPDFDVRIKLELIPKKTQRQIGMEMFGEKEENEKQK